MTDSSDLLEELIAAGTPARLVARVAALIAAEEHGSKVREQNRIRQRNHRARNVMSRDVTLQVSPPKEKSPTPPKEITPPSPSSLRSSGGAQKRASRLPADWKPINGDAEFALKILPKGWQTEADKFRDYWLARAGQQGAKLDWSATWRNWIRRAAEQKGIAPELPLTRSSYYPEGYVPE